MCAGALRTQSVFDSPTEGIINDGLASIHKLTEKVVAGKVRVF